MFNDFADIADDVYNTMDPPVPSRASNENGVAIQNTELDAVQITQTSV